MTNLKIFRSGKSGENIYINPDLVRIVKVGRSDLTTIIIFDENHAIVVQGNLNTIIKELLSVARGE